MPKQEEICNNCVYFTDGKSISGNIRFICAKSGVFVSSPDSYCRNFEKKTNMPKTKCDHDYKNTENGLYCFRCGQYKVMAEKTNMPKKQEFEKKLKLLAVPVFQGQLPKGIYGDLYDPERLKQFIQTQIQDAYDKGAEEATMVCNEKTIPLAVRETINDVKKIMTDTLSAATPREIREVWEMYQKLEILSKTKVV